MAKPCRYLYLVTVAAVILFLAFTPTAGAQESVPGVVRLKVSEALAATLERQAAQRTSSGQVQTGIQSLDQLNKQFNVTKLTRVFPHAGKHEARHREHGLHLWYEATLDKQVAVSAVLQSYQSEAQILRIEPVYKKALIGSGSAQFGPRVVEKRTASNPPLLEAANDPMLGSQWHYHNTGQTSGTPGADIDLFNAWKIETGRKDVIIAVTDGGVDITHPDLASNLWRNTAEVPGNNRDDDNNGYVDDIHGFSFVHGDGDILADNHGTHVAGTIAAVTNNNEGVAGVAGGSGAGDGVRIMSCAVFHADTLSDGFAQAYVYSADNGAVVSQNSWGYTLPGVFEQVVLDAIDYFIEQAGKDFAGHQTGPIEGGIVIFSAGNYNDVAEYYPAAYQPVIAVASSTHKDKRSRYSNYGNWIDITAPGGETYESRTEGVISTLPNASYGWYMGTSMACPHVSGVAGLIISEFGRPGLSAQAVRQRLLASVDNIDALNPGFEGKLGGGRLNALVALGANEQTPPAITDLKVLNKDVGEITIAWTSPGEGPFPVSRYEVRYSTSAITPANFASATVVTEPPIPEPPGSQQTVTVKDLPGGVLFYFAVRSQNFAGDLSDLSNVVSTTAAKAPAIHVSHNELSADLRTAEQTSRELTITNKGEGPLGFNISFTPAVKPFAHATVVGEVVSPGSSKAIAVTFDAAGLLAGTYKQTLIIESNDPLNKLVSIALTLHVTNNGAPIVTATPDMIDFKSVRIGQIKKGKIRIANAGSEPLTISDASSSHAAFSCALETPVTVRSFQYADVEIRFAPTRVGKFSGNISFKVNDPAQPLLTVTTHGEALQEAPIAVSPNAFNETLQRGGVVTRTMTLHNNGSQDRQYRIEVTDSHLVTAAPSARARKVRESAVHNDSAIARHKKRRENVKERLSQRTAEEAALLRSIGAQTNPRTRISAARSKSANEPTQTRQYVTGFEEFVSGPLNEQHGWYTSQGWEIAKANPGSGEKHLRGTSQPSGVGEKFALSPYLFDADEYFYPQYTSASMRINVEQARGTTWEVVPQDPWSYIATRIRFNPDGSMEALVIDDNYEFHWKRVPVQTPAGYFELAIEYNNWGSDTSGFPTYLLFVNNQHVFSGTGLGSGIGQVAFVSPMEATGPLFDVDELNLRGGEYFQQFIATPVEQGTIPANASVNVPLTFDATVMKYGHYRTDILVHIEETDTLHIPATLQVVGAPSMTWDLWAIHMEIEDGQGDWQQMTLTNTGGRDIDFNFDTDVTGLTISPPGGTLKVRESETIDITFSGQPGIYLGNLVLHNDAGEDVIFPVDVTVYEPDARFVPPQHFTLDIPAGEISMRSVVLKNEGKNPVTFYAGVWPEAYEFVNIEPASGVITDSVELMLTFDARELSAGAKSWPLEFVTNDANASIVYTDMTVNVLPDTVRAGKLTRERWTNIPGKEVSAIPLHTAPQSTHYVKTFETSTNEGDNYASRIRGYVRPPASGYYTFFIASDDHSELWISADENEKNKKKIAWVTGFTAPRQWTKYASQVSESIWLEADRKYYIEALHKEGTGGDHLSVGWYEDNISFERPIPAARLIPYDMPWGNDMPHVQVLTPEDGDRFSAPADVEVTTQAEDHDGRIAKVEFFDGDKKLATDITAPYSFVWKGLSNGTYSIGVKATDNLGAVDSTGVAFIVAEHEPPGVMLTSPTSGATIAAGTTVRLSASVTPADGEVSKVEFFQHATKIGEALTFPYFVDWMDVPQGAYTLTAMVTMTDGTTAISPPVEIAVELVCTATGTVSREYWIKVKGNSLSRIPLLSMPDKAHEISAFEASGDHSRYGERIRGYICPPASGEYVFWIASSGKSELWLSTDTDPANKKRIAMVRSETKKRSWDSSPYQRSRPVMLEKGRTYYIEGLHLHKKGDGDLAVGWQLPDGSLERPIAGARLSPFVEPMALPPNDGEEMEEEIETADSSGSQKELALQVYPNPVEGEILNIVVEMEASPENAMREIVIRQLTGLTVYSERQRCAGTCDTQVNVRNTLTPGVYILQVKIGERVFTEKVVVR